MPKDLAFPSDAAHGASPQNQEANRLVERVKLEPLTDGGLRASQLLEEALVHDPSHHEARLLRERLHQMFVPRWHFPMLADEVRNRAYAEAIAAKVRPGDIVLDIGCGAGLTAMLAARAGAKHVYTCEQQPLIAEAAVKVIERNGLSDRITVIPKMSHDLVVGEHLPAPADVVISEIVDTVLLGEGALETLEHAMLDLAKPDARAIPESGVLKAQLVESDKLMNLWRPRTAEGFDLSAFHHFATIAQITPNDFAAMDMKPLGPAADLFHFDFTMPDAQPGRTTTDLACTAAGTIHAVFVYFTMDLAPGIRLSNDLRSGGHWGRTAFLLEQPLPATPRSWLPITAQHDSAQLSLSAHEGDLVVDDAWRDMVWQERERLEDRRDLVFSSVATPTSKSRGQGTGGLPNHVELTA